MTEEKPSLPKVILSAIEGRLCDVNTTMPGIVQSYDRETQTAKIQPALKRKYIDGRIVNLSIINKVPVIFPRNGQGAGIHFDLEPNDVVTLVFAQRSLDIWKEKGGLVSPNDPRKFHLSDAYAIPGGYPFGGAMVPRGDVGSIEMQNGEGFVEVTKAGKFKISDGNEELFALLVELTDILSTTTVNTVFGPQQLNDFMDIAAIKTKLEAMKG